MATRKKIAGAKTPSISAKLNRANNFLKPQEFHKIVKGNEDRKEEYISTNSDLLDFMYPEKVKENARKRQNVHNKNSSKPNNRLKASKNEESINTSVRDYFQFQANPPYVNGKLKNYQINGLNWIISLHNNGLNGILADEMGLGKTLQTISFFGYLKHYENAFGSHLLVVPLSCITNWLNEFKKWCPTLKVVALQGNRIERRENEMIKNGRFDVLITTYEICMIEKNLLADKYWRYLVIDEGHRIKNHRTKLAKFAREFSTTNRLLLTGTPLQNNLTELWSLLNFILPTIFGSAHEFGEAFCYKTINGDEGTVPRLHRVLKPFLFRRIKSEVEKDLLPKKEIQIRVGLSEMQRKLYQRIMVREKRPIVALMQLRKCCNHPYLFKGVEEGPPFKTGQHLVDNSGKMIILDKLLAKLKVNNDRVLIFSQFTSILNILQDYCTWKKFQYCRLDGSTMQVDRAAQIDEFNAPHSDKFIFLISTRAGGLGINLMTANVVIVFDSDWNPQVGLQAVDRAHRIGQKKQVFVYRLIAKNTVDEKVVQRAEMKKRLDHVVIQQGCSQRPAQKISKTEILKNKSESTIMNAIRQNAEIDISNTKITEVNINQVLKEAEDKTRQMAQKYDREVKSKISKVKLGILKEKDYIYDFDGKNWKKEEIKENKNKRKGKNVEKSSEATQHEEEMEEIGHGLQVEVLKRYKRAGGKRKGKKSKKEKPAKVPKLVPKVPQIQNQTKEKVPDVKETKENKTQAETEKPEKKTKDDKCIEPLKQEENGDSSKIDVKTDSKESPKGDAKIECKIPTRRSRRKRMEGCVTLI